LGGSIPLWFAISTTATRSTSHTLRTIEHLQELTESTDPRGAHFKGLWKTAERRDLLILALLLHDVGKGMNVENHVTGSLEGLKTAAARLELSAEEKDEVRFLIERHLICPRRCNDGTFSIPQLFPPSVRR